MRECLVTKNHANFDGGGGLEYNINSTLPTIYNSTIANNSSFYGVAVGIIGANGINAVNSIFWGILNNSGYNKLNATNCIALGLNYFSSNSTNSLFVVPNFANENNAIGADGIWRTADDGFLLLCGSPAYNSGVNTNVSATDILGNPRVQFGTVDRVLTKARII
jgi:hypothetical protein